MASLAKKFKVGINTGLSRQDLMAWSKSATSDKYFRWFFFIWSIPLILTILFTLINFGKLPQEIPLFYSRLWGESQLAKKILIFLPTGGTLLLGIFNLSLGASFQEKDKIIAYFLSGSAGLVSFLSAITIFNIINLIK